MVFIFAPETMECGSMNFDNIQKIDCSGNISYAWFYDFNKSPSLIFFNKSKRSSISDNSSYHNLTDSPKSLSDDSNEDFNFLQRTDYLKPKEADLFTDNYSCNFFGDLLKFGEISSTNSEDEKTEDKKSENAQNPNLVKKLQLALSVNSLDGSFSDFEGKTENNSFSSEPEVKNEVSQSFSDSSKQSLSSLDGSFSDLEGKTENVSSDLESNENTSLARMPEKALLDDKISKKNNSFNVISVVSKEHNKRNEDPLYFCSITVKNSLPNIRLIHQNKLKKLINSRRNLK